MFVELSSDFTNGFFVGACVGIVAGFSGLKGIRLFKRLFRRKKDDKIIDKLESIERDFQELKKQIESKQDNLLPTERW